MSPSLRLRMVLGVSAAVGTLVLACSDPLGPDGARVPPDDPVASDDASDTEAVGTDAAPGQASPKDASSTADAAIPDAAVDAPPPTIPPTLPGTTIGTCSSTFGSELTDGFTRFDGIVWAVQKPTDQTCAQPNRDHVIVQLLIEGRIYRMVVNVKSTQGPPDVFYKLLAHDLPAPAFSPGIHVGAALDYPSMLDLHSDDFAAIDVASLTAELATKINVGLPLSIYATVGSSTDSAHLVHRNGSSHDGAIVINPDGVAPKFLLFHFDEQVF